MDPSNGGQAGSPSTFYTFACDTSLNFEINANMESTNYKAKEADDGGDLAEVRNWYSYRWLITSCNYILLSKSLS